MVSGWHKGCQIFDTMKELHLMRELMWYNDKGSLTNHRQAVLGKVRL